MEYRTRPDPAFATNSEQQIMGHRDAHPKEQLQEDPDRYLLCRLRHRTSLFGVELSAELSRLRTGASTPSTALSEAIVQKALRLAARIA
jgi:hypothetical protein